MEFKIIPSKLLFNNEEIKDGDYVDFDYKNKHYAGYFYIADLLNKIIGYDFMISEIRREQWKCWSWNGGYIKGFEFNKVLNFRKHKE